MDDVSVVCKSKRTGEETQQPLLRFFSLLWLLFTETRNVGPQLFLAWSQKNSTVLGTE